MFLFVPVGIVAALFEHLHWTEYVLWFTGPTLQLAVAFFMMKKGYRRDYPFFFSYTVYQSLSVYALFCIWATVGYGAYYYAYLTQSAVAVVLAFVVMYEIFTHAIRPYEALRDMGAMLFRWSGLILLLLAILTSSITKQTDVNIYYDALVTVERSLLVVQCGLVLLLILFIRYLGISSRHYLFGIALGLGVNASLDVMVSTARSYFRFTSLPTLRVLSSSGYLLATAIWLTYTLASDRNSTVVRSMQHGTEPLAIPHDRI